MNSKFLTIFLFLIFAVNFCFKANSQIITSKGTTASYKDSYGITVLEIKTQLKNNSSKTVSKIIITAYFRDKRYGEFDVTAPSQIKTSESEINIFPNQEVTSTFTVFPPSDINMVYKSAKIERVVYTDGTFIDFQ